MKYSLITLLSILILLTHKVAFSQFIDNFDDATIKKDATGLSGWAFFTGDGVSKITFEQGDGFGKILIDATTDKQNIWWALIKRNVAPALNLKKVKNDDIELRIEAKIRSSHALKRVNLHLNTQKTTDFHSQLMEFNIPDNTNWHTISMTTTNFDAEPGDTVFAQMALMDWGLEKYEVDIDYFKVDVINTKKASPDKGEFSPYHPPVPDLTSFSNHLPVSRACIIDEQYQDMNFYNWHSIENGKSIRLMAVSGTQFPIMKWDLNDFKGRKIKEAGVLELSTFELQKSTDYEKDFGMVRIVEILEGDDEWNEKTVTYESLLEGKNKNQVFNTQMVIDIEVDPETGGKNLMTIPQYVLQRMIDGQTKGIVILPLGAVHASFYTNNNGEEKAPKLHFNLEDQP